MKSRFTIPALILATAGYAGLSGTALATNLSGDCTLKYPVITAATSIINSQSR